MVLNKSSYTFVLKPGDHYEFEIEPVFYNTTTKIVEPMSASSKSTPREKKVCFGPITKFIKVDEEVLEIVNKNDERIQLPLGKLSPRIDQEDSMLKNTISCVSEKGLSALTSALNALVEKFHEEMCKKEGSESPGSESPTDAAGDNLDCSLLGESFPRCSSRSLLSKNSSKRCSQQMSSAGNMYREEDSRKKSKVDDNGEETEGEEDQLVEESRRCKKLESGEESERGGDRECEEEKGPQEVEDFMVRINEVVSQAVFMGILFEDCEVSNALMINREIVAKIKNSLQNHPDKCQCVIGVVRVVETLEKKKMVAKFQVFVNCEVFVAIQELSFEGIDFYGKDKVPAVVHTIEAGESLECETLGIFLQKNSKHFSEQMRESLNYQDLLRFCSLTIMNQGSGEDVKQFLKQALKDFGKGRQNSSLFIKFAMQSKQYLNKFETFTRLFETGSLNGQKLSGWQLCNVDKNRNRKKEKKLEVPVGLIKIHLDVTQATRDKLLDDLLNHDIGFAEYCSELKTGSELNEVRKSVENVAQSSFLDIKESCPDMFTDLNMKEFVGAKVTTAGPNNVYKRLVKHVETALGKSKTPEEPKDVPGEGCSELDSLSLLNLGRKMKGFSLVICALGQDKNFNQNSLMCVVEQVKDDKESAGVIINSYDENLREELKAEFDGTDILVEFIYVKKEQTSLVNGFQKQLQEVAVFAKKEYFSDRGVQTFHNCTIKDAISSIITDLVDIKAKVLYTFSEPYQAIELDPLGTLLRKGISVEYLAMKKLLNPIEARINKKIT